MADARWGHCRNCKHFGSPARIPLDSEEASCREPTLVTFELRVFGAAGCNHFELRPGVSRHAERPSFAP